MSPWRAGHVHSRFGQRGMILTFVGLFLVLSAIAVLIAALREPPAPKPACPNHRICAAPPRGGPPSLADSSPPLQLSPVFTSPGLGYQFEYPTGISPVGVTATNAEINSPDGRLAIVFIGASGSQSPAQLVNQVISNLQSKVPDLQVNNDPSLAVLGPEVGFRSGVGQLYSGTLQSPTGIVGPADLAIMASTDGQETIGVAVLSFDRSNTAQLFGVASQLLDTLRFREDIAR